MKGNYNNNNHESIDTPRTLPYSTAGKPDDDALALSGKLRPEPVIYVHEHEVK